MKFSIITPVYNTERWIAETIESVLSQAGDFEIEYIIRDGVSTDGTLAIIETYQQRMKTGVYPIRCLGITFSCISEKDGGMYAAINKGFAQASGDVFAWINADDRYEPDAFQKIQTTFKKFPEIQWLKGITGTIDEHGERQKSGVCNLYQQEWLKQGIYGQEAYFVEQDSVFWKPELWKKIRSVPEDLRYAGDYWLWRAFAEYTPLWSINASISNFRKRAGQLSKDVSAYKKEQWTIRPKRSFMAWRCRVFFSFQSRVTSALPSLRSFFPSLYPFFFPGKRSTYIEIVNGEPIKKESTTYLIPSYADAPQKISQ